ncbi:hypothetical protein TWF718_009264 [Orbilia javanica]|uniref:Uncharacterized protein n=1 Tax=Orbilia javanica TaxID=47235 RepID=A0AAN8RGI0_9PEZI
MPTIHEVHSAGDTLLTCHASQGLMEKELGILRVSYADIANHSPVFAHMLRPQAYLTEKKLKLAITTLDSVILAMNMIRNDGSELPEEISIARLYELLTFCARYKLRGLINPISARWITPLWNKTTFDSDPDYLKDHPDLARWLWVAYLSHNPDYVRRLVPMAALAIKATTESGFIINDFSPHPEMRKLTEIIWIERERRMELIKKYIKLKIELHADGSFTPKPAHYTPAKPVPAATVLEVGFLFSMASMVTGPGVESLKYRSISDMQKIFLETIDQCENSIINSPISFKLSEEVQAVMDEVSQAEIPRELQKKCRRNGFEQAFNPPVLIPLQF